MGVAYRLMSMRHISNGRRLGWLSAVLAVLCQALWSAAAAADQPQWGHGFTRNMISLEKGLPDAFDPATGKNIKWMAQLGTETYSTPIIANGRVLIGTNNRQPRDPRHTGDRSVLMCFDETDGKFLWQLVSPKITNSIYWDWPNDGMCSTVTVESNRVYLVGNRGEVLCLDLDGMANGNDGPFLDEARHSVPAGQEPIAPGAADADIVWLFDMIKECGVRQHDSAHSSILLLGDYLYVNTSNGVDDSHRRIMSPDAPSLIVVDKRTGRLVARDKERIGPRIFHSTWSAPALAEIQGRKLIVFAGGDGVVYAFEPISQAPPNGVVQKLKKVWQFDCDPTAPKENVHKYNSNRKESPSNIKGMPVFDGGCIYVAHGGDLWWGKHEAWLKCFAASGEGDTTATALKWSYPLERHSMSTPAVWNGLVFIADCGKKVHCLDANTGKPYWVQETGGDIWGSTLVADGKVYVGTRRGDFWIFECSKEKKVLSQAAFGSPINASPMAANGVLYVATMKNLYAIQQAR